MPGFTCVVSYGFYFCSLRPSLCDVNSELTKITYRIREIESGKITEANLENWFNCHVWSMVFDHAFENIKAISVIRYFLSFF